MAWVLTAVGVFGVATALLAAGFALLVFATGGARLQPRALAGIIFFEGAAGFWATGLIYLTTEPAAVYAAQLVGDIAILCIPIAHLIFLSTLDTPLTAWLRPRAVRALLLLALALAPLWVLLAPGFFVLGVVPGLLSPLDTAAGPGMLFGLFAGALTSLFGLAATTHSYRRARLQATREKARLFLVAFLARDLAFFTLVALTQSGAWPAGSSLAIGILVLVYVPLLAYGVLKAQLFDIDLKIKWTLRRGTVAGIFALVFVGVAEVAQNYLSEAYGYLAGGVAAAALLLAVRPLDRLSARVADTAMPRVEGTPAYVAYRKMEVYRAALEGAVQDGEVTAKEREVLRRLRESLGIAEADATALEGDVRSAAGV